MNSPALSDTLVTCSQVVRYLGTGTCWLEGVSGHGCIDGFIYQTFIYCGCWKVFTLCYVNASAELDGFLIAYVWILLLLNDETLF